MEFIPSIMLGLGWLGWAWGWHWVAIAALAAAWMGVCLVLKTRVPERRMLEHAAGPAARAMEWRRGVLLHASMLVLLAAWVAIRLRQWSSFGFSQWTLSVYANVVSNSLHGAPLYCSVYGMNHLGTHCSPIVLALTPLYAIFGEDPRVLMLAQVAAVFAGAWLLVVYARVWMEKSGTVQNGQSPMAVGGAAALIYLAYDPMMCAVLDDFHPSTLAPPLLILGLIALRRGNGWLLAATAAGLLCVKESGALMLASLALYAWLIMGRKKTAWVLAGAAVAFTAVYFGWIVPAINPKPWHQAGRVRWESFTEWPATRMRLIYLLRLLGPLAFLPLLDWRMLAVAAPHIMLNLATEYGPQLSAQSHYDDATAPLLMVGMIHVMGKLEGTQGTQGTKGTGRTRWARWMRVGGILILPWAVWAASGVSPRVLWERFKPKPVHARLWEALGEFQKLPYEQPVIATGRLAAPLSAHAVMSRQQTQLVPEDFRPGNILIVSPALDTRTEHGFSRSRDLIEKNAARLEPLRRDELIWAFRVAR